jgi:chromosome segregation ATPase
MSRKPSAETELRHVKRQLKAHDTALKETRIQLNEYRGRATKAESEAADWRKRFDLLLARTANPSGKQP